MTASDGRGGFTQDDFMIAAPATESGPPTLPARSFVYDDSELPLPYAFRLSRDNHGAPFWDTTPIDNPTTDAGATLGRVLFYDKRLSVAQTVACGSCHHQALGFSSGERFSIGVLGTPTSRHVMNLTNVRYNINNAYFSDMRVSGLENQVLIPIQTPSELGFRLPLLIDRLNATSFYPPLFAAAFGTPDITQDRIQRALAQFLRSLISYQSKFDQATFPLDQFGTPTATFTSIEQQGADLFRLKGCHNCHQNDVHVASGAFNDGLDAVSVDPGAGFGAFRPASLRNVAVSGPHMHDGRFPTVHDVLEHYSSGIVVPTGPITPDIPVPFNFTDAEKQALEAFLDTLTDSSFLADPKFSDPFAP
jgi:cytochrome c peroxidase